MLKEEDRKLEQRLGPFRGRTFLVYHSGWGYFARDYGLREIAIEQGGREPAARQLRDITEEARRDRLGTIFVGPQFPKKSAQVIAGEIGASLVEADSLAENLPASIEMMADNLVRSYEK